MTAWRIEERVWENGGRGGRPMKREREKTLREVLEAEEPAGCAHVLALAAFDFARARFRLSEAEMVAKAALPGWSGLQARKKEARLLTMARLIEELLEESGSEMMRRGERELRKTVGWTAEESELAWRDEELGRALARWILGEASVQSRIEHLLGAPRSSDGKDVWVSRFESALAAMRRGVDPDDPIREAMGLGRNPEAQALFAAGERARMGTVAANAKGEERERGRKRGL